MKKHLRKGFTLVELLVVLMLMGLITTAVVMALKPVTQIYADLNYKADEETGSITLFDFINGDLRYATEVQIVSTDNDTMPAAGNLKNFILLSNETRPSSKKGARGYAQYGKTSDPSNRGYCVSDTILGENDFQFSVDNYNTANNQQSMTILANAHPMKENSSRNAFVVNEQKPYNYKETIQFVNMRYSNQLSSITVNFSPVGYDATKPYHWILYTKPSDIGGGAVTPPSGSTDFLAPPTDKKGTKRVQLGAELATLTLVFQKTEIDCGYKITDASKNTCIFKTENGSPYTGGQEVGGDMTLLINIPDGEKFELLYLNNLHLIFGETADQLKLKGSHTVYIYNDGSGTFAHDDPYSPPGALTDTRKLFVHYLYKDGEGAGRGVLIKDGDSINLPTSSYSYVSAEGTSYSGYLNANSQIFADAKEDDLDIEIDYRVEDAAVKVYLASNSGNTMLADYGDFFAKDIPDGGEKHIYIYNSTIYENREEVPIPGAIEHNTVVHFLYNANTPDCNGLAFKDADGMKRSSSTDYGAIPEGQVLCIAANQGSLDVTCTIKKEGGKVELMTAKDSYNTSSGVIYTIDQNSPEHIWVYAGTAYENKDDIPGFRPIDKLVRVHYFQGARRANGVVFEDLDSLTKTFKVNGDEVPEMGTVAIGNEEDFTVDVNLVYDGAVVGVGQKNKDSDNMEGSRLLEINANSPDDIYIYNGNMYDSEDAAVSQRKIDEESGSTSGLDVDITWNGSTNNWGNANWSGTVNLTNNSSEDTGPVVVKIYMSSDVSNINQWGPNISQSGKEGNVVTYVLNDGIKAGQTVTINVQITSVKGWNDDQSFTINDVTVEPN